MSDACPRCGGERGDGRWCATCGLDSTPTAATLPTTEAMEAGMREREWFAARPEMQRAHEEAQEAAARRREERGYAYLAATQPATFGDYRDLEWRDRLARFWVLAVIVLSLVSAAVEVSHLSVLGGVTEADYLDSLEVAESNDRLLIVYLIAAAAYVLSGGFFIAWTWRAYKNAAALGAQHLRFGAGWAIGGWFVPVLNLWRPKQIVDDIWRTSEPQAPAFFRRPNWSGVALPGLLSAWWGLFIVSGMLDQASGRISGDGTLADDRTGTVFGLLGSLTTVVAGVLAILVVRRVTARQRERAAALEQLPPQESRAPEAVAV